MLNEEFIKTIWIPLIALAVVVGAVASVVFWVAVQGTREIILLVRNWARIKEAERIYMSHGELWIDGEQVQ
jgi:hypothetical protein